MGDTGASDTDPGIIPRLIPASAPISVEKRCAVVDPWLPPMQKAKGTAALLDDEEEILGDIDMDRVVADPLYRRTVIDRLRRERLESRQRRAAPEAASDDED
jgi:hypothetical protein